jgi:hypothetical protein
MSVKHTATRRPQISPIRRWISLNPTLLLALGVFWFASGGAWAATYHLDDVHGDDNGAGTSPDAAWRSLERANRHPFQPGDRLLLRAGSRFVGQLAPQGSGTGAEPIRLGKYGTGDAPRLDGQGQVQDTLLLRNVEFWEVADLEITNQGERREPWRTGVRIVSDGFGRMRHIYLHNLHVHDVNGDLRKEQEGCGIFFESRGGNRSHFDGLRIENCRVVRTDRNGICQRNGSRARSTGVVIRGNRLEDIGGDGIKLWGSNGGVIEHNVLRGARMRCEDYAAGIWPFDCDDTLIQFNEVSGVRGTKDGQAFDSDYRCRRSVFQYNYSHDNEGGFMLICAPGNSYNEGTIIRYNLSQNDGINSARVFHISGAKDTLIHNNTLYIGTNQDLPLVIFNEWSGGNAQNTRFVNNLIYVDGRVTYDLGKSRGTVFENNLYFGNHVSPPTDANAVTNAPPLAQAGGAGDGFAAAKGYRLTSLPAFLVGQTVTGGVTRDFFGQPVPTNRPPAIGCAEFVGP